MVIPTPTPIERRDASTLSQEEFINNYYWKNKPLIITGLMKDWKALGNWSNPDYLIKKIGHRVCEFDWSKTQLFTDYETGQSHNYWTVREILEAYFKNNSEGKRFYIQQNSIPDVFPELVEDMVEPPYFKNVLPLIGCNIWAGVGGTVGQCHVDLPANFLCMVSGTKTFRMYPPSPRSVHTTRYFGANCSVIDVTNPDYERYPRFKDAVEYKFDVKEGEVLFLPPMWWHQVSSSDEKDKLNIAVTWWYVPSFFSYFAHNPQLLPYLDMFARICYMNFRSILRLYWKKPLVKFFVTAALLIGGAFFAASRGMLPAALTDSGKEVAHKATEFVVKLPSHMLGFFGRLH